MKTFIALILVLSTAHAFSACEEYMRAFDQFVESEIATNKNLIRYLNQNSDGWQEADSLVRSGRLNARNYNGGMRTNARNSEKNANAIQSRNYDIRQHAKEMKAELERCLEELQKPVESEEN